MSSSPGQSLLLALALAGCAPTGDKRGDSSSSPADYSQPGSYGVGRRTVLASRDDGKGGSRSVPVEVWFPATASAAAPGSILDLVTHPADRTVYGDLLDAAPSGCPTTAVTADVLADPLESDGGWPLIAMSHCHDCTRFSTVTIAERLASWGFVVVAPDHTGNTLFDAIAGTALGLDTTTLALREGDLDYAIEQAVDGHLAAKLTVDPTRIGVFGHSFGAVTAGMVLQDLPATGQPLLAGMFVGAPPENPLLSGVSMANLTEPVLFEELAEDNSVGTAGNVLIESNYAAAPGSAWLATLADAGHYSPSDLDGITATTASGDPAVDFSAGCGDGTRQTNGQAFTYMPAADGRALSASIATAFFAETVAGHADGADFLTALPGMDGRVAVEQR